MATGANEAHYVVILRGSVRSSGHWCRAASGHIRETTTWSCRRNALGVVRFETSRFILKGYKVVKTEQSLLGSELDWEQWEKS